jgi:uncharacterized protein YbjT (DUF2867 family)
MNIVVTGSLGHISKPLTLQLLQGGHAVTVVSSSPERQADIESLGAAAAIGSIQDTAFLTQTFRGADAVYLMEPPVNFFDHSIDIIGLHQAIAGSYKAAVEASGVKKVVHLSSIGAHTDEGNGMLAYHYAVEQILAALPESVSITTLRPVGFYYNLLAFIPSIKAQGAIFSNYSAGFREPWVSPADIAAVAAEELTNDTGGRTVRYIASDEATTDELAGILGNAVGKPDLKWVEVSDEQALNALLGIGFSHEAAKGMMEMNAGRRGGALYEDYFQNRPALGKVKLADFGAADFAAAYHQSTPQAQTH